MCETRQLPNAILLRLPALLCSALPCPALPVPWSKNYQTFRSSFFGLKASTPLLGFLFLLCFNFLGEGVCMMKVFAAAQRAP